MFKTILTAAALLSLSSNLLALSPVDSVTKAHKEKKVDVKFIPVLSYAPETRFLFGAGALAPFKLHNDSITHHSLIEAFVAYSQNKQDYVYVPYLFYTKNNNYYFEGETDFYNFSYYYWGIGENRVPQELYNVQFPKITFYGYRKITTRFYAGIDYFLQDDIMGKIQAGQLDSGYITGSKGGVTSGLGIDLFYDTRDSIFFPRKGCYIKANSYYFSPAFGSNFTFWKVQSDASYYYSLANPVVLAVTEHNELDRGTVPFDEMALVGGTKQIRGYYMGYYRDDILTYAQAEARIHLIGRVAFAAFGTIAFYGNYQTFPETPSPVFAEGVGLRYNYERKQHINVRFDAGYGVTWEYYLTIQEAF